MLARIYTRASTVEQDATRALASLRQFAAENKLHVAASYTENASGTQADRPELLRLLADSTPGDLMLIEGVDRLSRLGEADWGRLRRAIDEHGIRVVSLDLPTSYLAMAQDEFTRRLSSALSNLMIEILAANARKDWEDRRRRTAQGIERAKAAGDKYLGRKPDIRKHAAITKLLQSGASWNEVISTAGCSRSTVARIAAAMKKDGDTL